MLPLVSIVTINYNQPVYTIQLLESLRRSEYPSLEIIVVDNASEVNPKTLIEEKFPEVKVIVSETNLGFAGGNNLGIREARGKYIFLLNNDTEITKGCVLSLVQFFEAHPDAGIASPKILFHNSGNSIQYVGCSDINPYTGRNHREGFMEKDHGQFDAIRKTDLVHGAAMMIPRAVIEKVGMMSEIFFLYYEELDWCMSIRKSGYSTYVVPQAVIYHKESMSIGKNSVLKTFYMTRNRLLFMRRHTGGIQKLSWIIFFMLFSIPKNTIVYLLKFEMRHLSAFWKGVFWNVVHDRNSGSKIL